MDDEEVDEDERLKELQHPWDLLVHGVELLDDEDHVLGPAGSPASETVKMRGAQVREQWL